MVNVPRFWEFSWYTHRGKVFIKDVAAVRYNALYMIVFDGFVYGCLLYLLPFVTLCVVSVRSIRILRVGRQELEDRDVDYY